MMSRITISRIRKVCSVGFGPRLLRDDLCNMPAYAVIRKDHKSAKSTDDGPGQTGKGTDFPILKTTPIDTQTGIPITYRERCQKIIDKAFGSGSAEPDKGPSEQYCSPTINIEDTKREMKEAENARIRLEELKNIENPVIPDDRQCGIFKMSRELIKVDDDGEITVEENTKKIASRADTKILIQKGAPLPELTMKEVELDNIGDHVLNISNPVTSDTVGNKAEAYDDTDAVTNDRVKHVRISDVNPDKKWVLNVTTANENDVKLAQKLETVEEIPLVEAQRPEIEGFNVNPKILGDQLNPILTIKSINNGEGISPGHDTLDEAAKRCLNGPLGQLDEMLVKEMDKLGIPLTCKPENKISTTLGEDKLLQMDLCNEKKKQQQEIYPKSAESENQDEKGNIMVSTTSSSRYHLLSQVRLPVLNEQAEETTLFNSEDVKQLKEKDGVPYPEQTKKEIKPVSCDNNPTAKLACSRTPTFDGYEDEMEESHYISISQDKNINQTIQKEIDPKHGLPPSAAKVTVPIPSDVESMQNLHLSIFKQLTERATTGSNDKNIFVKNTETEDRTPHTAKAIKPAINPTNPSSHHHLSSSGEVEYHHDRTLQDNKWDRNIENSSNKDTAIKPCSKKLYADENSECKLNLKPEKVTLPEELMKEHELDPYYVLTCNETCPISPGLSMSTCKNTNFVDTSETIYMKKNICESIRPKPNQVNVKSLMSQCENLIADTQAEVNNKISAFGEPKQEATQQVKPQCENVQADTQVLHTVDNVQFELVPEITPEIKDMPIIKPGTVSPKQTSLPSKEEVSLTELLRRVRKRNRMQCTRDLGVKVDPTQGECHKKGPRCTPTAPRSPPANPVPPPSFGLPMVKARPKVCVPKKKGGGSKKCTACDIDAICGVQLGNICPAIACNYEAEASAAVIRVDLTDMVIDHIQNLGKIVVEVLRQMKSNVETLLAREFDPWAPIPSWPIPKKPEKPCEKWTPGISGAPPCVRGCPVFPKARASMNPEPPCTLKPCEGFPKRSSFSALDSFAVSLGKNKVYDLGQF